MLALNPGLLSRGNSGRSERVTHKQTDLICGRARFLQRARRARFAGPPESGTCGFRRLRCHGGGEPEVQEPHVIQPEAEARLWNVPWDGWHTATVMTQLWAVTIPLGVSGVAIVGNISGYTAETMGGPERALAALVSESIRLAGVLIILRSTSAPYQPLPRPWFDIRPNTPSLLIGISGAFLSLAAVASFSVSVTWLLGNPQALPDAKMAMMDVLQTKESVAAAGTASILLAPVLEEAIYRGFLLPSLTRSLSVPFAVVISSAAFAASHLGVADLQSCVALFFLGCVLGTTAVVSKGALVAPLTAHSVYNAVLFAAALQTAQ